MQPISTRFSDVRDVKTAKILIDQNKITSTRSIFLRLIVIFAELLRK